MLVHVNRGSFSCLLFFWEARLCQELCISASLRLLANLFKWCRCLDFLIFSGDALVALDRTGRSEVFGLVEQACTLAKLGSLGPICEDFDQLAVVLTRSLEVLRIVAFCDHPFLGVAELLVAGEKFPHLLNAQLDWLLPPVTLRDDVCQHRC